MGRPKAENDPAIERCKRGWKVKILLLLEKTDRMSSKELAAALGGMAQNNLSTYTNPLVKYGLIEVYDESRFKPLEEVNMKYRYYSILDAGRELIADLGKKVS